MTHDDWAALLHTVQEITETIWLTVAFILPFIYVYLFVRDLPVIIHHFRSGDWKRRLPDPGPPPLEPVIPRRRRRGFSNDEPTLIIQSIDDRTSIYTTGPLPHTTRARIGRLKWVRQRKAPTPATTTRRVGKHRAAE